MIYKKLNTKLFTQMLNNTVVGVVRKKSAINRLNVFPVPDGDTGNNVLNTLNGGIAEINKKELKTIAEVSNAFSYGTLLGARGNSGVITSQIYKGLAVGLSKAGKEITVNQFIKAIESAKEYAYKAVSNPSEGTILSVVKKLATELPKINILILMSYLKISTLLLIKQLNTHQNN